MSKFDNIWCLAADKKLELQGLKTPQEICTTIARELFKERGKYNLVKGWFKRTYPGEWPPAKNERSTKESRQPLPSSDPQLTPQADFLCQRKVSYSTRLPQDQFLPWHEQDGISFGPNGYIQQELAAVPSQPQQANIQGQQHSGAKRKANRDFLSLHRRAGAHDQIKNQTWHQSHTSRNPPCQQDTAWYQTSYHTPLATPTDCQSVCLFCGHACHSHGGVPQTPSRGFQLPRQQVGSRDQHDNSKGSPLPSGVEDSTCRPHRFEGQSNRHLLQTSDAAYNEVYSGLPDASPHREGLLSLRSRQSGFTLERKPSNWENSCFSTDATNPDLRFDWENFEKQDYLDKVFTH